MNVSIALATYNGEKYILQQLESILPQLQPEDEIILSDDGSKDNTIGLANSIKDKRIRVISNPDKGITRNFQNAILHCNNDIILLCDQDDVWTRDKIKVIKQYFESVLAVDLIVSDAVITDEELNMISPSYFDERNSGSGFMKNFIKNSYIGCCMAFRKEFKDILLPIPVEIAMHDWWIGMLAELTRKVIFIPEKLVYYRRHSNNVTGNKPNSYLKILDWRIKLLTCLVLRVFKLKFLKKNSFIKVNQ